MNPLDELVDRIRTAERHQYGRPLSRDVDARVRASWRATIHPRRTVLKSTAGAVALAVLLLSMRALSSSRDGGARISAAEDIGDAAMIEAGIAPAADWETRPGGPRDLP
jgi:hypothetical protein